MLSIKLILFYNCSTDELAVSILHATLQHASARRKLKLETLTPSVEWCHTEGNFFLILISVPTTVNESSLPESPPAAGVR